MSKPKMSAKKYPIHGGGILRGLQRYTVGLGISLVASASTCLAEVPAIIFSIGTEDQSPAEFLLGSGAG